MSEPDSDLGLLNVISYRRGTLGTDKMKENGSWKTVHQPPIGVLAHS